MTPHDEREPKLIHVRHPLRRIKLTFKPTVLSDEPVTDGPLIPVGHPLRRGTLTFEPVGGGTGEAEDRLRRHLVGPGLGRPLARLVAAASEALRTADERAVLASETGAAGANTLRRLKAALLAICAEAPDASLDPELFGAIHTMLLFWALGVDLDGYFRQPTVPGGLSSEGLELMRELSA